MTVVVLAGGTGGAKLARGLLDIVGDDLVVVANTADDLTIYGGHVSPDPDLCALTLLDRLSPQGWGIAGDTFHVMDGLRELGRDVWFNLGDHDLALAIERQRRLDSGERLTTVQVELAWALGLRAPVLPMCDEPVRTWVRTGGDWHPFQEFMIRLGGSAAGFERVEGVEIRGLEDARLTDEVAAAVADADAIIVGPSNPIISVGPILGVPGLRAALAASPAPIVAVSPIVGGTAVKGPTVGFMAWAGRPATGAGVAAVYGDLLDGMVCDDDVDLPALQTDLLMGDPEARRRLAAATLEFARSLA